MKYIIKAQNGTTISGPTIRGKQYPKGTIVTNDRNDPRLISYQDSVRLYNEANSLPDIFKPGDPELRRVFDLWAGRGTEINPVDIRNRDTGGYPIPVFKKPTQPVIYQPFVNGMTPKGLPAPTQPTSQMLNMPDRIEMDSRKGTEYKGINISHYTDGLGRYTAKLNLSTTPGIRGRISYKDGGILKYQKGTPYTPKEFTEAYINSPNYLKRLEQSGYEIPVEEQNNRLGRVKEVTSYQQKASPNFLQKAVNISKGIPYSTSGSTATPLNAKYPSIVIDQKQAKRLGESVGKIGVHTMSHHETGLKNGEFLNEYDKKQLINRSNSSCNCEVEPHENKADLNAIRYELFNKKVDVLNGEITPKNLKLLDRKSLINKRMTKSYNQEDLLWLLNNIASNSINSTNRG